jgi:hypothetical protein
MDVRVAIDEIRDAWNRIAVVYDTFVTHTLRQTGPNYWGLADGQC